MNSFLEALPSLEAENTHILKMYVTLVRWKVFSLYIRPMCLSEPVHLYPSCLGIHMYTEKVICVTCLVKKRRACTTVMKTAIQRNAPPSQSEVHLISISPPSSGRKREIAPGFIDLKKKGLGGDL